MLQEHCLETSLGKLNFVFSGNSNSPILFLHGVTRRWQTFSPIFPSLVWRWNIVALDFQGHGRSSRKQDAFQYRVVDYVQEVLGWIEQRCDQPLIIYGHSLGAMVAAAVAKAMPNRLRGLILEDPPLQTMGNRIGHSSLMSFFQGLIPHANSQEPIEKIAEKLSNLNLIDPQTGNETRLGEVRDPTVLRFMASCLKQLDPRVLEPIVNECWLDGYDIEKVFGGIHCPTLLIQADTSCGGMLTDEDANSLKANCENLTHVQMPGVGHSIHWSQTQTLLNYVHGFLESLETSEHMSNPSSQIEQAIPKSGVQS